MKRELGITRFGFDSLSEISFDKSSPNTKVGETETPIFSESGFGDGLSVFGGNLYG